MNLYPIILNSFDQNYFALKRANCYGVVLNKIISIKVFLVKIIIILLNFLKYESSLNIYF